MIRVFFHYSFLRLPNPNAKLFKIEMAQMNQNMKSKNLKSKHNLKFNIDIFALQKKTRYQGIFRKVKLFSFHLNTTEII